MLPFSACDLHRFLHVMSIEGQVLRSKKNEAGYNYEILSAISK